MALPFPKPNGGVGLLIGDPLAISAWSLTIAVECKCGPDGRGGVLILTAQEDHLGRRSTGVTCPACGHTLHLVKMGMNPHGQIVFDVNRSELRADAIPVDTSSHHQPAS